jgi:hypothetical protein
MLVVIMGFLLCRFLKATCKNEPVAISITLLALIAK